MVACHIEDALPRRPGERVGGYFEDVAAVDGLDVEGVVGEGEYALFHYDCFRALGDVGRNNGDGDWGRGELDGHFGRRRAGFILENGKELNIG